MDKKKKIIFGIVIIFVVLLISGITLYFFYIKSNDKLPEPNSPEVEEPTDEPSEILRYKTSIYSCLYGGLTAEYSDYCNKEALQIPSLTKDAKVLDIKEEKFILYYDETLRIYNIKTKAIEKLKLAYDHTNYLLNIDDKNNEVVGIIYYNQDKNYGYYDIKKDKKMYENKYDLLLPLNDKYIQGSNINNEVDEKSELFLLDATKEKTIKKEDEAICKVYDTISTKKGTFYLLHDGCIDDYVIEIYDNNLNTLAEYKDYNFLYSISNEGYLYFYEDNKIKVYEPNGKIKQTYLINGEVLDVFYDYYLIALDNKLWIKDYDNYSKELGTWQNDYTYHKYISGYFEENELTNDHEKDKGYYFVIETNKEGSGIEYYFNPEARESKSWILNKIMGYAKPVLYLYPEKETKIKVTFEHPENLTTTYPRFNKEWVIIAKPNGDLYDLNNKYYYGLYWEEKKNHLVSFKEGFYVTNNNAIEFLEEKLSVIGLNDKERNEFIMYWLPILEKNKQNVVYFELTEEREKHNKLEIIPKPDSILRFAIHVKKVNGKVNIKEQKLPKFKRDGFVVVEWGGIEYK